MLGLLNMFPGVTYKLVKFLSRVHCEPEVLSVAIDLSLNRMAGAAQGNWTNSLPTVESWYQKARQRFRQESYYTYSPVNNFVNTGRRVSTMIFVQLTGRERE